MKTEFNLSDKIEYRSDSYDPRATNGGDVIILEDVKEFIRLLKERIDKSLGRLTSRDLKKEIDKLAGDKLT